MNARTGLVFLALILTQAAHSVEEYIFRLYDVFAPVRFVCSLIHDDPATGFVISNTALVLFGLGCYMVPVRTGHRSAKVWVWIWIIIEVINGMGHTVVALARGSYFPVGLLGRKTRLPAKPVAARSAVPNTFKR